jgi:hypothetical protein
MRHHPRIHFGRIAQRSLAGTERQTHRPLYRVRTQRCHQSVGFGIAPSRMSRHVIRGRTLYLRSRGDRESNEERGFTKPRRFGQGCGTVA